MSDLSGLERRVKQIEERLSIQNQYQYKFEELAGGLDRRTLEEIWVGVDTYNIAVAFIGLTIEQLINVKRTFSKTRWTEIRDEYRGSFMKEITEFSVRVNRDLIMEKILRMERKGEIVLSRGFDEKGEYLPREEMKDKEPLVDVKGWVQSNFEKVSV